MERRNRNVGTEYNTLSEALPLLSFAINMIDVMVERAWDGHDSITTANLEEMRQLGEKLVHLSQQGPTPSQMRKFFA